MSLSGPPSAEEVVAALVGTSPRRRKGRTPAEGLTQTARARTRAVSRLDLRGVSVLVVEDHPDSRELLREIVESFGATVVVAGDGEDALRKVARVRPGLVLCDLRMPLLDGFGFIDRLRRDPALSRTPVIAVTALGTETDVMRTWQAGFNGHLVKPIDYGTIAAQLARVFWAHWRRQG